MKTLLTVWTIILFASSAISVLALSAVQTRLIRREGWHVFRRHKLFDLYWRNLGSFQRALIWPGLIAFLITLLAATVVSLFNLTYPNPAHAVNAGTRNNPPY